MILKMQLRVYRRGVGQRFRNFIIIIITSNIFQCLNNYLSIHTVTRYRYVSIHLDARTMRVRGAHV